MRDRLTVVEVETLRTFAGGADWVMTDTRTRKAMRRLARRGYAVPYGRVHGSDKPAGMRLVRPAHEILADHGFYPAYPSLVRAIQATPTDRSEPS